MELLRIPVQRHPRYLSVSIQTELSGEVLQTLQKDILKLLQTTDARWVIFDVSGIVLLDSKEFSGLRKLLAVISLMGAKTVISGLRPGVASCIVEFALDFQDLRTCLHFEQAVNMVRQYE